MSQVVNSSSCSMRSNLILIVVVNGAWLVHWAHLIGNVGSLIGCLSNWKFIGSSKLLTGFMVQSKTSLMGSPPFYGNFPLACTQFQFDQFIELSQDVSRCLSSRSFRKDRLFISCYRFCLSLAHYLFPYLPLSLSVSLSLSLSPFR